MRLILLRAQAWLLTLLVSVPVIIGAAIVTLGLLYVVHELMSLVLIEGIAKPTISWSTCHPLAATVIAIGWITAAVGLYYHAKSRGGYDEARATMLSLARRVGLRSKKWLDAGGTILEWLVHLLEVRDSEHTRCEDGPDN